jgi:hypothetical protein
MYDFFYKYYYIVIILQAICVLHCLSKGTYGKWIWIIIVLPFVGSIAYIYTEIIDRNKISEVKSGLGSALFPDAKIKKLEENLKFADTFNNKILLADAYLATRQTEKAIALYENSMTGNFEHNEYACMQLIQAYFEVNNYSKVVEIAGKIKALPQFPRSKAHIQYAWALAYTGNTEQAETEFKTMKGKFSNYEGRYEYSLFLIKMNRSEEAKNLLTEIVYESNHLNGMEKRDNRIWFVQAKDELKKLA